jgi:DNA-binding transcriptional ArsR family regulator
LKEVAGRLIRIKPGYMPCCIYELAYFQIMKSQAIFDVMSDPTRRRILGLLAMEGELCVCEMTAALDEIQPKVSRHLSVIRGAGFVRARREGTRMFYQIEHQLPGWQRDMIDAVCDGAVPELSDDRARLRQMSGRPARVNSDSVHA